MSNQPQEPAREYMADAMERGILFRIVWANLEFETWGSYHVCKPTSTGKCRHLKARTKLHERYIKDQKDRLAALRGK